MKLDVAKAYDSLDRDLLWRVLAEWYAIPPELITALRVMYGSVEARVKWRGARSSLFPMNQGVRQGLSMFADAV